MTSDEAAFAASREDGWQRERLRRIIGVVHNVSKKKLFEERQDSFLPSAARGAACVVVAEG